MYDGVIQHAILLVTLLILELMMRINARLDPEYIDKLEVLKQQEHLTTTEVIKKALGYYYEMKKQDNNTKIQQLLESDFIACGGRP